MANRNITGGKWTFTCTVGTTLPSVLDTYTASGSTCVLYVTSAVLDGGNWIIVCASDYLDVIPNASGTLTRTSGSGDASITNSARSCPSTVNIRDVKIGNDDTYYIVNDEHPYVEVICDAGSATTSVINNAGGFTDAQSLETYWPKSLTAGAGRNGTYRIKNNSTTVPLIVKMFTRSANYNVSLGNGKTTAFIVEGANAGVTKWISLGSGTGALNQTIQMNVAPSVAGLYIDNPPFVQVEAEAGSGVLITTAPTAGATYTNNSSTYTVSASSITAGKGTVTATKTTGTNEPSGFLLTKATGTGDAVIGLRFHEKDSDSVYTFHVGEAYDTYTNIGGAFNNYLNTAYTQYKTFGSTGTTRDLGCFFEYNEYNGGVGYGKIIFATSAGGFAPPNLANIRIPNIHFTSDGAAGTSVTTRCKIITSYLTQGNVSLQGCSFSDRWGFNQTAQYYSPLIIKDVGISGTFQQLFTSGACSIDGLAQSLDKWVANTEGCYLGRVAGSLSINNVVANSTGTGLYGLHVYELLNDALTSCDTLRATCFTRADALGAGIYFNTVQRSDSSPLTIRNVKVAGKKLSSLNCANLDITKIGQSDTTTGASATTFAIPAIETEGGNKGCIWRGIRMLEGGASAYDELISSGSINNDNCAIHDVIYTGESSTSTAHTNYLGQFRGSRMFIANIAMNKLRTGMFLGTESSKFPGRVSNATIEENEYVVQGLNLSPVQTQLEYVGGTGANATPVGRFATTVDSPPFQLLRTGIATCSLGFVPGSLYQDKAYRTVVSGTEGSDFAIAGVSNLMMEGTGVELIYSQDLPIKALKNAADTFSGATVTPAGTSPTTGVTYSFRMSRWGTALSGAYATLTAANLQTAFDAIRHASISTDGIDFDLKIETTTALIGRALTSIRVTSVNQDTAFVPTEVGFIQVGYRGATSGTSMGLYDNTTPATPLEAFYQASTSETTYLAEFPYNYGGKTAQYRFIARKAGYAEKSVESECWQAGATVPMGITLNYACTDADIDAANLVLDGSAQTFVVSASHTMADLYQRAQWWAHQQANMLYDIPLVTNNGSTFTQPSDWMISGLAYLSAGTIAGGTVTVAAPATLSVGFSGVTMNIPGVGTYVMTIDASILKFTPAAPGTYVMGGGTYSGTLDLRNQTAHAITIQLPGGTSYTTANNTGGTITVDAPIVYQGIDFNDVEAGSTVKIFDTGTQTVIATPTSPNWSWTQEYTADVTVDYTIQLAGKRPIRVTGVLVGNSTQIIAVQQQDDRAYVASSGLTFGTNCFAVPGTKLFGLTTTSTLQNFYSRMIESWITEATLQNKAFPLSTNGPNSFTLGLDLEWDLTTYPNSITSLSRDGMRYMTTAGTETATWSAILTAGVPSGIRVRYQQADETGTTNAAVTSGNMDELVKVYGDATHGNFDKRSWMILKAQLAGYDEAEADLVGTYDNLEDQFYVIGLVPTANGIADQAGITGITFTDHGASPVTWNGKVFSLTIKDNADALTGTQILQYFRNLREFNYHDLVRVNGTKFKTVRGNIYCDTGATLKGVRVVKADGTTSHPDFDVHTADDGTTYTYSPPVTCSATAGPFITGSRVWLYDTLNSTLLFNDIVTGTSKVFSETYSIDRTVKVRISYVNGTAAKEFYEATIGTITSSNLNISINVEQDDDAVYNSNAIAGSGVTGVTFTDAATDLINIDVVSNSVTWPTIYAAFAYWMFTESGIDDDIAYIEAKDTANYTLTSMQIKNTSSPTEPLVVSGGYGIDSVSGASLDLVDTTGGTLIFAPDHVVAKVVTVGGVNIITGDIADIPAAPTAAANATAVRSELTTELGRIDVAVSSRLAASGYTSPDNAGIATIAGYTDSIESRLPAALIDGKMDAVATVSGIPTAEDNATAVLNAASIAPIHADVKKVIGQTVDGAGTESDPWGPQ